MLGVDSPIQESLQKFFGFTKFKGNQEAIIKNLLDGNDSFCARSDGGPRNTKPRPDGYWDVHGVH